MTIEEIKEKKSQFEQFDKKMNSASSRSKLAKYYSIFELKEKDIESKLGQIRNLIEITDADIFSRLLKYKGDVKCDIQGFLNIDVLQAILYNFDHDLMLMLNVLIKCCFANCLIEKEDTNKEIKNDVKELYRGQSNHNWGLQPSMFRSIKEEEKKIIDYEYLKNKYKEVGLLKKYESMFEKKNDPYHLLSFIQHACSYSPLIDLSEDKDIATAFALSNMSNFNEFYNTNAAILTFKIPQSDFHNFTIEVHEKMNEFFKDEYKLYYYHSTKIPLFETDNIVNKKFSFCTFDEVVEALKPKFKIFTSKTNDRMINQKGCFIVFYDCLVLDDFQIRYKLCDNLYVLKNELTKGEKLQLKESLKYNIEFLLDPYKKFIN